MADTNRERSSIRFPYGDLDDAVAVAGAIYVNHGLSCSLDQLAVALNQTISGAFRNKVATASTFGVVEPSRGLVTLTDLGEQIVDPQTEGAAKVRAFLQVPLYAQVVETFRGRRLPGDQGLEAELVKLGVSSKQVSKARQALYRSAEQAGFFRGGRDRLVEPPAGTLAGVGQVHKRTIVEHVGLEENVQRGPFKHALIQGLFDQLPDPQSGTLTPQQQADWLEGATVILRMLYGGPTAVEPAPSAPARRPVQPNDKPYS